MDSDWSHVLLLIGGVVLIIIVCLALANYLSPSQPQQAEGLEINYNFAEFNYTLENGCKIPCLLSSGIGYGAGSGLTCDWSECKR